MITALTIRNFRSILSFAETTGPLNIFVGQNDEGKSNILRALDLFFNHTTSRGYAFDWDRDFCAFATKRKGKADEIAIEIEVTPPSSFTNRNPVIWRKTWRHTGLHSDEFRHRDKTAVSPKSKIAAFLKTMRFDYVPAIKGPEFFQSLMGNLHDMLERTVEEQVRTASGAFTSAINTNTQAILDEIRDRLELQTSIALPSNLRELFTQLEFTSISGEKPFSLNQRGDGIKVRHIPIVLRWLAQQANYLSAPGRPKTVTVWGYEEPENNLELRRCFELAKDFVSNADEIQAFVTTHSPAFYSVFRESDPQRVFLFLVTKADSPPTTDVKPLKDVDMLSLDSSMGLLALLEPHFKDAEKELKKLRSAVAGLTDTGKPTIFVEGPTDRRLFSEAIRLFYPQKQDAITIKSSSHHGGGHTWVAEQLIAWSFSRPTAKAVGLFDKDAEALASMKAANAKMNIPPSGKKAFGTALLPNEALKACSIRHMKVPFGLEELLTEAIWDYAGSKNWLEDRNNPIALYGYNNRSIAFDQHVNDTFPETHFRRLILKKVRLQNKEELAAYVCTLDEPSRRAALESLKVTIEELFKQLGITTTGI
jgi:hypothetical protein